MHNTFKGIVVGFIGFILWGFFSVVEGVNETFGAVTAFGHTGTAVGFALMTLGPLVYGAVLPAVGWVKRRRRRRRGGSSP